MAAIVEALTGNAQQPGQHANDPQNLVSTPASLSTCTAKTDLKTLLMHGSLHETAASETFHQLLLDVNGQRQASFQGSASLVGTKMILHNSKNESKSGKIQLNSAVRWAQGCCASVEVLGLAPGSDFLFALKTAHDDAQWKLAETAPTGVVLDTGATLPDLSGLGLAVRMCMLDIDRPVADIALWANTGQGWTQRIACRTTTPEPFVMEVAFQAGDVLATFSDVFMRKVKCPALRAPGLGLHLQQAAACPAPALFPMLAATSIAEPAVVETGAAAGQPTPSGGITEEPGHSKPFCCPDGKRFTTLHNAERWLKKSTESLQAKLQAPSGGDANAVMQHMAAAEAAAQALDSAAASARRPAVVISCPQLTITSPCTTSTLQTVGQLLPLAVRVLSRAAPKLASPLLAALAAGSCPSTLHAVLQSIASQASQDWPSAWVLVQQGGLWASGTPPADVSAVAAALATIAQGGQPHLDVSTAGGVETWQLGTAAP